MSGRAELPWSGCGSGLLTVTCAYSLFLNSVARNRSPSPTASAERNALALRLGSSVWGLAAGMREVPNNVNRIAIRLFTVLRSLCSASICEAARARSPAVGAGSWDWPPRQGQAWWRWARSAQERGAVTRKGPGYDRCHYPAPSLCLGLYAF